MLLNLDDLFFFFNYFYNKVYSSPGLKLSRSPANIKCAETFLEIVNKEYGNTVSKEFLYTYCLFQFNYWDRLELKGTSTYNNTIQLSFIFGKKAFDRYKKRDNSYDWQLDSLPIIKKYGLRKSDLIEQLFTKQKIAVKKGIDTEAPFKLAFFNTLEGFNTCKDYSTLFNHKSSICGDCLFKDNCKKFLKTTYPTLYMDRGYK